MEPNGGNIMAKVVILGAAGRVGDAAARAFVQAGWTVAGVARSAKADTLAPGVTTVRADVFDRNGLINACRGADVILNAVNPKYTEWNEKVLSMAENVIAAAEAVGATHMLPGNVYNFGHAIHMDMKEDGPDIASTPKAAVRIAMEGLFRERAEKAGVRTIVLRAGDFYGGIRRESWLDLIILAKLHKNVFTWGGPMDVPHAFAYLPDLAAAFVALAERRDAFGSFERFHFEGHTLTGAQMKEATEAAVGRRLALRRVPWPLLRVAGLVMPIMHEVAVMSYLWRTPHSLDGTRLAATVGPLAATSPVDALRQAIDDLDLDRARRAAA